jgi:malate permease and related proteins
MPLNDLLATFANNILPIMLISGVGFALGKALPIDSRSVGRVIFYIFSPILVFDLLLQNELPLNAILKTMSFSLAASTIIGLLALLAGRLMRLERPVLIAILLTTIFGNTGNYGLPLVSFAFGKDALAYASLYFVTNSILFNTVGVLLASLGHMDFKQALLGLLKVPTVYAVVLALGLNNFHLVMPAPLVQTVQLAANGAIPLMLVLLGLELVKVRWSNSTQAVGLSTFLRLAVGPLIGLLLAIPFGLSGAAHQGNVVEASVPSAVTTTVLATEYNVEPALVTAIVFVSTLLSPLTLTPLLVILGR